ncbi:MAG TPA: choice-of-anchor tandem repeat GloVer-containing protein, partial [Thermoanaerobaculia bacterium]|nr:choice-of-anchor tandem repeat GloVer-containing protein [Thermoanaerobaculia bacterium]
GGGAGSLQVLYSFTNGSDGSQPFAGLTADPDGNLYGVASAGGDSGAGTVFELVRTDSSYAFRRLYSFSGGEDGAEPVAGLVIDRAGNLYGSTARGGAGGSGTVFELGAGPSGYSLTTLYAFSAVSSGTNADGAFPEAPLLRDRFGNLFGTAAGGGPSGDGAVFELARGNAGYSFSVLHALGGGGDGAFPVGGLVSDRAGNLFGTASGNPAAGLWGTVFEISSVSRSPVYRTLYAFQDGNDGALPYASLIIDSSGDLIGTAAAGGESGAGTIFELAPAGSDFAFRLLYSFAGGFDGGLPAGGVAADSAGRLYGTTMSDGLFGWGTVFALSPPPSADDRVVFTDAGAPVAIALSAHDPGLPGASFTYAIETPPQHGTLTPIVDGITTYTPGPDFSGSDAFTYTATDAGGTSNPATVIVSAGSRGSSKIQPVAPVRPASVESPP